LFVKADGTRPLKYQWLKDGNIMPDTTNKISTDSFKLEFEGTYICNISNSCGSVSTDPATLSLTPSICMVTVTEANKNVKPHNLIICDKESKVTYTKFKIYRESTVAGFYDSIGNVSYVSEGIYEDMSVNPKEQAYLYKITAVNSSNVETAINSGSIHKTIHLLVTKGEMGGIQLDWDQYIGFPYSTYYIYRSTNGIDFSIAHTMASSTRTWTDDTIVGSTDTLYYYISVKKTDGCYPNGHYKSGSDIYSQSVSNMEDNRLRGTDITATNVNGFNLSCYPNPFDDFSTISYNLNKTSNVTLTVSNIIGERVAVLVNSKQLAGFYQYRFSPAHYKLSPGIYMLQFKADNIVISKRMVETK
jgi:hypothetical protein